MTTSGPLAAALDRLAHAVEAAETAAEARLAKAGAVETRSKEAAKLETALTELRRDHANLKGVTDDVARRLDGAIAQVEAILAGRP